MKKLFSIIAIILIIFFIYIFNIDKKITYLNISDTENPYTVYITDFINKKDKLDSYINNFSLEDYRITALINDIESNRSININGKNKTLKNTLVTSDLITLSIGNTDLYYKINYYDVNEMYDYIDELLVDYELLFKKMRKITKEKIIVFGYTSLDLNKEVIDYYNDRLETLCIDNKINFIRIDNNTIDNLKKEINSLLK